VVVATSKTNPNALDITRVGPDGTGTFTTHPGIPASTTEHGLSLFADPAPNVGLSADVLPDVVFTSGSAELTGMPGSVPDGVRMAPGKCTSR
jgi:hypothetical protein